MKGVFQFTSFEELPAESRLMFDTAGASCFFPGLPWLEVFVRHALDGDDRVQVYSSHSHPQTGSTPRLALATVQWSADSNFSGFDSFERRPEVGSVVLEPYFCLGHRYLDEEDWMSSSKERVGILALNKQTLRGAAPIARHVGCRAVKHTIRSSGDCLLRSRETSQEIRMIDRFNKATQESGNTREAGWIS